MVRLIFELYTLVEKMTEQELASFKQRLLDLGHRLRGDVAGVSDEALRRTGGEASGSLSNAPLHPADLASDSFEQDVALSLLVNEQQIMEQISSALNRIEQGTFGRCQECQLPIAPERLKALPYTAHCIGCARELQSIAGFASANLS